MSERRTELTEPDRPTRALEEVLAATASLPDTGVDPCLDVGRVREHVREAGVVQALLSQHRDLLVDLLADPDTADLLTPASQPSTRTRSWTFLIDVPLWFSSGTPHSPAADPSDQPSPRWSVLWLWPRSSTARRRRSSGDTRRTNASTRVNRPHEMES